MESLTWPAREVALLSDLSQPMVNYVTRIGVLNPLVPQERERGRKRRYCFADVVMLRTVQHLSMRGISLLRLAGALQALELRRDAITNGGNRAMRYFVTTGADSEFVGQRDLADAIQRVGPCALVVDLNIVRSEVTQAIDGLLAGKRAEEIEKSNERRTKVRKQSP